MLKRRKRIQKYILALKNKKRGISRQDIEKLKLESEDHPITKQLPQVKQQKIGVSIPRLTFGEQQQNDIETNDKPLWMDEDDQLNLPSRNMFKKLQLQQSATERQYEERLRRFYNNRYGMHNWAVSGQGEQEKDLNDLLNHEEIYAHGLKKQHSLSVSFMARTTEHHNSIVTGVDWKGQVVASCGYDQKLKLWSLREEQSNPELKLKQQKDVYTEGYPLSNCYFRHDDIILGTLRQNYLVIDIQKWKINKVSSSFLNIHPTFQHIRLDNDKNNSLLFSDNKISILNKSHSYLGGLVAGQPLEDVQFSGNHQVLGASKDCLYQWDIRMWKMVNIFRLYNAFTKLWTNGDTVALGNKLGIVNLSTINEQLSSYADVTALVTHVTELKGNKNGELLVECSKWKHNAVRIIDVHKGKVIAGWPAVNTKVGLPTVAGFSQQSQLCVANTHGYLSFFKLCEI